MKKLTATQEKARKKKLAKILDTLQNGSAPEVLEGLKKLKEHGDATAIPVMVDLFLNHPEEEVSQEVKKVFLGLNDDDAVAPLLHAVSQNIGTQNKAFLLSAIWESGLKAGSYVTPLTDLSTRAEETVLIEILTIADTIESDLEEEVVTKNLKKIRTAVDQNPNADTRNKLLLSYAEVLTDKLIG